MALVTFEIRHEYIGVITLHRPEAANALSQDVLKQLHTIFDSIAVDPKLRVVIITGAGEKAFCAGADLKERKTMDEDQVMDAVQEIHETANRIEQLSIPVIAAINGVAFGGGLELALACDIRIIAEDASVGLTETALAIIPGAGGTQRLARLIGPGQAKALIYRAARIDAKKALELQIVEEIAEKQAVLDTALFIAKEIAANGPLAIQLAKKAINEGLQLPLKDGLRLESTLYKKTIGSKDRLEGLQAFSEKRKPVYKGE